MGLSKFLLSARHIRGLQRGGVRWCTCAAKEPPPSSSKCEGGEKESSSSKEGSADYAVLGVYEKEGRFELSPEAAKLDQEAGGKLSSQLNELSDQLKLGKSFLVTNVGSYKAVALASYGPRDAGYNALEGLHEGRENVRWGVGAGVRQLMERGAASVGVDPGTAPDAAAEAAVLAGFRFNLLKSGPHPPAPAVSCLCAGAAAAFDEGRVHGAAQNWARTLSDMPANKMTPLDLAQAAIDMLCPLGVKVTANDQSWIEAQRMEAFLAVARGSCEPPVLLECEYKAGSGPGILVVAKGVTFDSGGLCLKKAENMVENRGSMAGAAAALAALYALAKLKAPVNINMVIPLCENMISGQCMKVGDVVRAMNGLSIQIEDTDMEGRLMMADALVYGQAAHRPGVVLDIATFTHGILLATGGGAFGCFSNDEALWECVRAAGAATGDRAWRFPLWEHYATLVTDDHAVDLRNKGSGKATPCIGAAFLKNFICGPWLHMDTTGVGKLAHSPPPYLSSRRMTGRPTRTLARTLLGLTAERLGPRYMGASELAATPNGVQAMIQHRLQPFRM